MTLRLRDSLPSLRATAELDVCLEAFRLGSRRTGFRVVQASVQTNHLHLLVEADDAEYLARGVTGLLVRIARGLNRIWRRRGPVFSDRFHSRDLRTARDVRNTLVYVLQNARKHGCWSSGVDPFSSGPWFDGWSTPAPCSTASPFARASTWLLTTGWRRLGAIGIEEAPAAQQGTRKRAGSPG